MLITLTPGGDRTARTGQNPLTSVPRADGSHEIDRVERLLASLATERDTFNHDANGNQTRPDRTVSLDGATPGDRGQPPR
ncbi:MAG: hypothetical protein SFY68_14170 [Candidatus Sumerlaeia bacterium]|nr:hypothetical protein [Candidatus Sumerlaeia bacterium]